jgi:hypothetical protein
MLDQPALMELLALRQNGLCQRYARRPPILRATLIRAEA